MTKENRRRLHGRLVQVVELLEGDCSEDEFLSHFALTEVLVRRLYGDRFSQRLIVANKIAEETHKAFKRAGYFLGEGGDDGPVQ